MAESANKLYPYKEEDIQYEKELVDAIKKLPVEQRLQAIAINHYQLIKKRIDQQIDAQIDDVIRKFNGLQAPLANRSNQLIAGEVLPNEEEVKDATQHLTDEEKSNANASLVNEPIPDYWFKVLTTCERFVNDIFEPDHPLLKKITKIENVPSDENEDFEIKFHFAQNDYFENETLSVKFHMLEDGQEPEKTTSTEIKWKEGKDITKKKTTKKQKNKKTGKTRTVEKIVDAESFFNFFKSLNPTDGGEEGDDEEGGDEELERLNINFDIANALQEEIVPYHLEYYLGLRKGDGYGDFGGEDFGDDGEDDDDEEEEAPKPKKGGKAKGAAAAGGKDGEKPECKQQ